MLVELTTPQKRPSASVARLSPAFEFVADDAEADGVIAAQLDKLRRFA